MTGGTAGSALPRTLRTRQPFGSSLVNAGELHDGFIKIYITSFRSRANIKN